MHQSRLAASGVVVLCLAVAPQLRATTVNVDCNAGAAIASILSTVKPGDVVLVQGTCRENVVIQSEVQRVTLDGQEKTTMRCSMRDPATETATGADSQINGSRLSRSESYSTRRHLRGRASRRL